jgi:hypothetical protein
MYYFRVFNKKGESELTRDFGIVGCRILKILREQKKIKDVMLMMELDFNPETWRHWRSKFIELFEEITYQKPDSDIKEQVVYDKKQKLWQIHDV